MEIKKIKKAQRKRRLSLIAAGLVIALSLSGIALLAQNYLFIKEINFYGNRHLTGEDLQALIGCPKKSGLFSVSTTGIYRRLKTSPWIKDAMVRKDLTGKVTVSITEAVAVAVLQAEDKPYLVDREGLRLEEIKEEPVYFLPVIKIDPAGNKDAYQEAVAFAGILYDKKVMAHEGNIEITGTRAEDITMKVDNMSVKIGVGDFTRKLEKLNFVRDELARRNMTVEYIDLRFADKIVVKPLKQESRKPERRAGAAADKGKKNTKQKKSAKKMTGGRAKEHAG